MEDIIIKVKWNVNGLTPQKMLEGINWYLKDFKEDCTTIEIKSVCLDCRKQYPKCKIMRRCLVIKCDDQLPYNKESID